MKTINSGLNSQFCNNGEWSSSVANKFTSPATKTSHATHTPRGAHHLASLSFPLFLKKPLSCRWGFNRIERFSVRFWSSILDLKIFEFKIRKTNLLWVSEIEACDQRCFDLYIFDLLVEYGDYTKKLKGQKHGQRMIMISLLNSVYCKVHSCLWNAF